MIEIRMTGVVATQPRRHAKTGHPPKVSVRVDVIDAKGNVQWIDCGSTNEALMTYLLKLRIGDAVEIAGNPAWCYYPKSDGRSQGLQIRVSVNVVRRLGSTVQHQPSKEHANA